MAEVIGGMGNDESAIVLDAVEKAVGQILQDMYAGSPIDESGILEAEIAGWIKHRFHCAGIKLAGDPIFTKGFDEERGYWINAAVRIAPDTPKSILIEFVKCAGVDGDFDNDSTSLAPADQPWDGVRAHNEGFGGPSVDGDNCS